MSEAWYGSRKRGYLENIIETLLKIKMNFSLSLNLLAKILC